MSRRDQIRMSDEEVLAFLDDERVVTCATIGPRGWPHLMPLWYLVRDREIWAWTYAKSQKVRNLERDPRCTLQVEAGERYEQLRGLMLRCEAVIHRDPDTIGGFGAAIVGQAAIGLLVSVHLDYRLALTPVLALVAWGAVQTVRHASLPLPWSSSRA